MPIKFVASINRIKSAIVFVIVNLLFIHLAAQPVVTSFSPSSGQPATIVTINGSGFSPQAESNIIYFGGVKTTVATATASQLTVKVPLGATSSLFTVTTGNLTAYSPKPFNITTSIGSGLSGSSLTPVDSIISDNAAFLLTTADMDGDGKADLIVTSERDPYITTVYRNTSTGNHISFAAPLKVPNSVGVHDVATGDLDGDGMLDMVVTNYGNDSITIFRNVSTPGSIAFEKGKSYKATGMLYAYDIIIRDLNADGRPDIAFVSNFENILSVFINNSSAGNIQLAVKADFPIPVTSYADGISIGDFNGDNKPDVVVSGNNWISIFINRCLPGGQASLQSIPSISGPKWSSHVETGDIDGDGKIDIVAPAGPYDKSSNGVFIFRNTTTDTAIAKVAFSQTFIPCSSTMGRSALADFDGDGRLDISLSGNPFLIIHNISTPGNIRMDRPSAGACSGWSTAVADLDEDGRPDMIALSMFTNSITFLRNTNEGPNIMAVSPDSAVTGATILIRGANFTGATGVKLGSAPASSFTILSDTVISAVISTGVISDSVEVIAPLRSGVYTGYHFMPAPFISRLSPAYGTKGSQVTISGRNFKNVTALTFGGQPAARYTILSDTTISAIVGPGNSGAVSATSSYGNGAFAGFTYIVKGPIPVINSFSPLSGPAGTLVTISGANFSSNPAANVVFFGAARGVVVNASSTQLTVQAPTGATYKPLTVVTDHQTGIAPKAFNLSFQGGGVITDSTFKSVASVAGGYELEDLVVVDMDGDGLSDVAVTSYGAEKYFSIIRNISSNNTLQLDTAINMLFLGLNTNVCTGDLNSDGKPDLVVTCEKGTYVFKNTSVPGKISFDTTLISFRDMTGNPCIRDFNNDGKPDLVFNYTQLSKLAVYKNIGVDDYIAFAAPVNYTLPRGNMPIRSEDMDGDGKADLVQPNYEAHTFSVFRNTSTSDSLSFAAAVNFGTTEDAFDVTIGDLDGDGKPEVMICYPNSDNHTISVYRNTSTPGNFVFTKTDYPTGYFVSQIGLGDVDGDGMTDVVSVGENIFAYKNLSTSGNVVLDAYHKYSFPYGMSLGVGDLSGDGKPDLVATETHNYRITAMQNMTAINNGPLIYSFAPAMAAAKDTIFIKGTRFSYATSVTLGGTTADYTIVNDSLIQAIVNNGSTGNITITTPAGSITRAGFVYKTPLPVIRSFQPASGTAGDIITVSGLNFASITGVLLGGTPAASFSVLSDSVLSVIIGKGATGSVFLVNPTDTVSKTGFTYEQPLQPSINSFFPATATTGMAVTLKGLHLDKTTQVFFGGVPAVSFKVHNDTSVTAIVGTGASGAIVVNGSTGSTSIAGFTFRKPSPVLLGISPAAAAYGDTVMIHGQDLYNVTGITLGYIQAAAFKVINDTTLMAIVGRGASGNVEVVANGIRIFLSGFTYIPPAPVIIAFTKAAATGDSVTLRGTGFTNVTQVNFGSVPATYFRIDNDSVIVASVGYGGTDYIRISTNKDTVVAAGFRYLVPAISSFTPNTGREGDTIRLSGDYLTGVIQVSFGGVPARRIYTQKHLVVAVLGQGATGPLTVKYYNTEQAVGAFTFKQPDPAIYSFYPVKGTKGDRIVIHGLFNLPVTNVTFGDQAAASFTQDSIQGITAVVGPGNTGEVGVVMGNMRVSLPGFTYILPKPVIMAVTPLAATTGTVVRITGINLANASMVAFGGMPAASFIADSTSITAIVGSGATGDILVATPNGTTIFPGFVYTETDKLINVFPNPVTNGTLSVQHPASYIVSYITITDMNGLELLKFNVPPGESLSTISTLHLKPGIYLVKWADNSRKSVQRIIIL